MAKFNNIEVHGKRVKYYDDIIDLSYAVYLSREKNKCIIYYGAEASNINLKNISDYDYFIDAFFN